MGKKNCESVKKFYGGVKMFRGKKICRGMENFQGGEKFIEWGKKISTGVKK